MKGNKIALRISALAILISTLLSCGKKVEEETLIRPVEYEKVSFGESGNVRTFNGVAKTNIVINLSFRSSGILSKYDIAIGKKVKKGDLLASLDNVQARLAYEQALASRESAESQMKTAKLAYDRIRSLYEKGSASLSDFENAKNSYQNAKNSFESAKRSVDIQRENINFGYIYAPEDGIISSAPAEIGENINPGKIVGVLNGGDDIEIELGIPETIVNLIKENSEVEIRFPALPDQEFKGRVIQISPAVDLNTSTYPVKVLLIGDAKGVKSGMAAYVSFMFDSGEGRQLSVPTKAVGEDSKGRFVFVIKKDDSENKHHVFKTYIKLGALKNTSFEVLSGLKEGEMIATAGLQTLLDKQEVKIN